MSILIVTPKLELCDSVRTLFLSENTPFKGIKHHIAEGYTKGLVEVTDIEDLSAVLLVVDEVNADLVTFIEAVGTNHRAPIVALSDSEEVITLCKAHGVHFFLPYAEVTAMMLAHTVNAAQEYFQVKYAVKNLEERNHLAEQRFRDVADHFADWLWEVDHNLKITFSSSRRRPIEEAQTGSLFTACFLPDEQRHIEDDFERMFQNPRPFQGVEYWSFDSHGSRVCWQLSGVPVFDMQGEITGYRGMAKDISSEKSSVDQLYYLANNDMLTGFNNRNRFTDELNRIVRQHKRSQRHGALILLNLDRFKHVNDTYGFEVGDQLIVHAAQVLKDSIRSSDFVARLGGDEFAIILSDINDRDAEFRAKKILESIKQRTFLYDDKSINMTGSVGIVHFPVHGRSADELLTKANIAMQEAKGNGQNCFHIFREEQLRKHDSSRRMETVNFVMDCLNEENDKLVLYYQPIVALNNPSKNERYEVLVRLIDEENNIVPPIKFIEIAEEFGLIARLDEIVVTRAIRKLKAWQEQGKDISLSINLSGRTFENEDVMHHIRDCLEESNLKHGSVVFEITETSALKDLEAVRRFITEFKRHGAAFALDDCGVGYASFSYIRELDLDYIKIDGAFVRDLHRNKEDDAFVRALRDIARRMHILTVAEMVEKPETVAYLQRLGIDFAQGYHFAMPAPELPEHFPQADDSEIH